VRAHGRFAALGISLPLALVKSILQRRSQAKGADSAKSGVRGVNGGQIMRISRRCLEEDLFNLLGTGRNAHIAAHYYGFDGLGGRTLKRVGSEVGLTQERVRQVVTEVSKRLSTGRQVVRVLDRVSAFVVDRLPATAGEIEAELRSHGLTSGLFRLEGILKAVELLGRPLPFSITKIKGERLVHRPDIRLVDLVVRVARRTIARWGIATLSYVAARVRNVESHGCDRNFVAMVLERREDFQWLDAGAGWFWLSDNPNNPVLNRIRKVLSIANAISISELRAGIARDYKMKGISPPARVLLEFCGQASGLRVNDNTIRAIPAINPGDVLTECEKTIANILFEHGGVMASAELEPLCVGAGMKRTTFRQCLAYSPIISKCSVGIYGLIGSNEKPRFRTTHAVSSTVLSAKLQVRQVAEILGVSLRTVWYHAQNRSLKATKVGKIWYFDIRDVYEFKHRI
jgi:hypothetical protein